MLATNWWYSPEPDDFTAERLTLDFGLRTADQFYRELVVPGLGRVWFVRQLSWPLAALALHADMKRGGGSAPKPTAICHGIEALACKLEYYAATDEPSSRILGKRAFDRDEEKTVWNFSQLRHQAQYVRNTHRAAATRTVRTGGGLAFASGQRFDLLELEPVGLALANAFLDQRAGQGNGTLRKWLKGWVRDEREVPRSATTLWEALSPEMPTRTERNLVSARVLDGSGNDGVKRKRLADATGRAAEVPDIENVVVERLRKDGHGTQAAEVLVARAFGAVLDRARDVVAELTRAIEPARGGLALATVIREKGVRAALKALRTACEQFTAKAKLVETARESTSGLFADAYLKADDDACVRLVVARAGDVLCMAGPNVARGGLFRVVRASDAADGVEEGSSSIEPDRTGRSFRIANLHSLLRDLRPRQGDT